ncbi:hypothetical protein JG686_21780, partial [Yersinia pestis subsp. pestis]|nr:hypothetical protein [Yersinia pestis subsp. pestis]
MLNCLNRSLSPQNIWYPEQGEYIERLKVEKLAVINDWRLRQECRTVYFEWNGHRWDANDISKER